MIATFSLSPAAAKRLIGRGLVCEPDFRKAFEMGKMVIGVGTTNAYIADELGVLSADEKSRFAAGIISNGVPCVTDPTTRMANMCLEKGQRKEIPWEEFVIGLERDDVFIKGANAFDTQGNAGILVANPMGGTIGGAFGVLASRGCQLIIPVGHEKLIPSCEAAAKVMGIYRVDHSLGQRCGLAVLSPGFARIYTELDALKTLFGVDATVVAAGGISGSEGSVMLAVEGDEKSVNQALALARSLLKEKPISIPKQKCKDCWASENCVYKNKPA
ncbi:MAG: hypothetical protein GXY34_03075 [Syntrophomonadaceae bacterium]|nr:hypothetical protein [Syntrophomonadaceae bacterium]